MLCLVQDAEARVRDIAERVEITERAVQRILVELEEAGALARTRVGRRNRYTLNLDLPLRHELESHHTVGDLLLALADEQTKSGRQLRDDDDGRKAG